MSRYDPRTVWPGTSPPPNAPRPRRRRGKGSKRRNGPTSTERLMIATARKLGVAAKPRRTTEQIGRCLDHVFSDLNFSSAWALAAFLDDLAARSPGKKGRNVRLPAWKTPEGVRYVLAVPCGCTGAGGCRKCQGYKYGIRLVVGVRKRESKCNHEVATTTVTTVAASAASVPALPSPSASG